MIQIMFMMDFNSTREFTAKVVDLIRASGSRVKEGGTEEQHIMIRDSKTPSDGSCDSVWIL